MQTTHWVFRYFFNFLSLFLLSIFAWVGGGQGGGGRTGGNRTNIGLFWGAQMMCGGDKNPQLEKAARPWPGAANVLFFIKRSQNKKI